MWRAKKKEAFDPSRLVWHEGADEDTVRGGPGDDLVIVSDGDANDTVDCGQGDDTVYSDPGDALSNCEATNP